MRIRKEACVRCVREASDVRGSGIAVLVERGGCVRMASGSIERGKRMLVGIITANAVVKDDMNAA